MGVLKLERWLEEASISGGVGWMNRANKFESSVEGCGVIAFDFKEFWKKFKPDEVARARGKFSKNAFEPISMKINGLSLVFEADYYMGSMSHPAIYLKVNGAASACAGGSNTFRFGNECSINKKIGGDVIAKAVVECLKRLGVRVWNVESEGAGVEKSSALERWIEEASEGRSDMSWYDTLVCVLIDFDQAVRVIKQKGVAEKNILVLKLSSDPFYELVFDEGRKALEIRENRRVKPSKRFGRFLAYDTYERDGREMVSDLKKLGISASVKAV